MAQRQSPGFGHQGNPWRAPWAFGPGTNLGAGAGDIRIHLHQCQQQQSVFKQLGNSKLKEGHISEAIKQYSIALTFAEQLPGNEREMATILSNRAHAYYKLCDYQPAVDDALSCIQHAPKWWKGYYRAAMIFKELKHYTEALEALHDGLQQVKDGENFASENKVNFVVEIAKLVDGVTDTGIWMQTIRECKVKNEIWSQVVLRLAKQHEWDAIFHLFLGGGKGYPPGSGGMATGCNASGIGIEQYCSVPKGLNGPIL
ncbi:uncharacterized protein LOC144433587 isoform X3 [Glandiceps talaboti]